MANSYVPDVKTATWRHPYKFSGRVPFVSFLMMLAFGAVSAVLALTVGVLVFVAVVFASWKIGAASAADGFLGDEALARLVSSGPEALGS